jgi:hypothetical protein
VLGSTGGAIEQVRLETGDFALAELAVQVAMHRL